MITVKKTLYIFMGPPGSGKGSLAALCTDRLGWRHLSAGNLCRDEIAKESKIGKQIDFTIKSGKLISDSLIVQMITSALCSYLEHDNSIILDGFPRTLSQAIELDRLMQQKNFAQIRLVVVRMAVSDEVIIKRIMCRLVCPNTTCQAVYAASDELLASGKQFCCDRCDHVLQRRSDDTQHVIKERLKCYHEEEKQLLNYYATKEYPLYTINLEEPLENAFQQLVDLVGTKDDHN